MNHQKLSPILICSALLACSFSASNSVAGSTHYRWINERGIEVHSDRPPPAGIDYEVISAGTGLKRVVPGEEGAVPAEVTPSAGNDFTQVNTNEQNRDKKNPELCARAQKNLQSLTAGTRVKVRDSQGEERYLTDEELVIEKATAEAQIGVYCP